MGAGLPPRVPGRAVLFLLLGGWLAVATLLGAPASAQPAADPVGVWPLVPDPTVVRGFDPPDQPWGSGHRGVDLLGRAGQVVRAALPGRVAWSGVLAGRGVVVVDHGMTRTTYQPVVDRAQVGTAVAAGDRIGRLGVVGSHCAPRSCLHWGWIEGATYLDPLRLVGAGPVRLLPLWQQPPSWVPSGRPSGVGSPYAGWRPLGVALAALETRAAQALGWAWW